MPSLTFYPLGNADCILLKLDRRTLLFDYAAMKDPSAKDDLRCNLPEELRNDLGWPEKNELDIVAFTHLDDDHVRGASDFFWFEHANKYQSNQRIKIRELWVPAAAIVEVGCEGDARIIREEAKYRLREGRGIRVFSRPSHLKEWFAAENIPFEQRQHLIVDAGQLIPGFDKETDGAEFFVHSPFAEREGDTLLDRNDNSIVLQAVVKVNGAETKVLLTADTTFEIWDKIVEITRTKGRDERLQWDIYKLPHHCSYLSLSATKGTDETVPSNNIKWLLDQGRSRSIIVSTSWPIENEDQDQPPHFQAKRCYTRIQSEKSGHFKVTMEYPNRVSPKRLVINITAGGASIATAAAIISTTVLASSAPRVGRSG